MFDMEMLSEFLDTSIPIWRENPVQFFEEVLNFEPDDWQIEVASDVKKNNRVAVKSGQGVGKTAFEAAVFLWFLSCFYDARVDAFVQPKLDDPELMEFYKVNDRLDMPETLFADRDDFRYANKCVMEACGLAAKRDEEETVKNLKN